jgi:DNA primase catalytic core
MGRIPESEIERLKEEVSVQRLAESAGVKLTRHGADLLGLCPFHDDKSPSLVISPAKNLWNCLGACSAGGSSIDWVMRAQGVSFRHAIELLRADDFPLAAGSSSRPVKRSTVRVMAAPVATDADDRALLSQVVEYYHESFKNSPEAQGYLMQRGLMNAEAVSQFKIGFANRTLGYRLPEKNRAAGEKMRGALSRLGILRESGHEHFNGSLVVPVFGVEEDGATLVDYGNVQGIYGRKINDALRKGTPMHLYLPGPHRGVWNESALTISPQVILCESLIDALTFWCAGFCNVTAAYGVNGFTDDHLAAFKKYGTKRVMIAYDRDEAGDRAAKSLAEKLLAEGFDCFRVLFPKGMDANEYATKVKPPEKALSLLIRNAEWMGKGVPNSHRVFTAPEIVKAAKEEPRPSDPPPSPTPEKEPPAAPPQSTPIKPSSLAADLPPVEASPEPPPPASPDVPTVIHGDEITITLGDRRYRVRGLPKNNSFDCLKVNLLCGRGEGFFVDTLDLYSARQRAAFVKAAAEETGVTEDAIKKDLGKILLKLEELQEEQIRKAMEPKAVAVPEMAEGEREAALALLRSPDLLDKILADFIRCGVVGEETNKLTGYLSAVSRKLDEPLAVILQSSSAAGKTSLMDAVLAFVPDEDKVKYSAMTGQSLFYLGDKDLRHKVLAIAEEEGVRQAAYALKLLQSEGELTIASTGKDPASGKLTTHEYRVEGPVMIFMTTTAVTIEDEELQNRCITLSVNEDRAQTRAIHVLQRERQTIEGLLAKQRRAAVLSVHRNAQRLLRPLSVVNPYANSLTFRDDCTRTRRDHMKYLTLIRTIALLHQYQREIKARTEEGLMVEYIEATTSDIATANRLAHEVLGRSLDELSPQTRRLLLLLDEMVTKECARLSMDRSDYRFLRRELRAFTGMGDTQLKIHLSRLVDLEYLVMHRAAKGNGFTYELLYDGQGKEGGTFLMGLIDVETLLPYDYDKSRSGEKGHRSGANDDRSGCGRPPVGPRSGGGRGEEIAVQLPPDAALRGNDAKAAEKALIEKREQKRSYVVVPVCRTDGPAGDDLLLAAAPAVAAAAAARPAM